MWSSLARIIHASDGGYQQGDWRSFPKPENQPNMPIMEKLLNQGYDKKNLPTYMIRKSVKPAVEVFQQFEYVLNDIELPEEARNYLN